MGCNDYNLHLDSSEGNESPTPEFKIYLDGVGVNGYSPTIDIVNSTSSSFQIQATDINGTELTSPIPKLDYITNNYVSNASLASTLAGYLQVDGSNADNPITINNISLRGYTGGIGRISTTGTLQIHGSNTNIYGTSVGIDVKANSIDLGNWSSGKYLEADTTVKYGTSSTKYEIATVNDISNATITFTQGGVTKGAFTLNGSATTINLDAGGGSITNPLVINNQAEDRALSLGIDEDNNKVLFNYSIGGFINVPIPLLYGASQPLVLTERSADGLYTLSLNIDDSTIKVNQSGQLYAVGGGGGSYTAGTGIDITSDVISVDNTVAMKTDIPDVSNFVTNSSLASTLASYVQSSSLGSAAYTASTDYATAAQGSKADTAVQPADLATVATSGSYTDLSNKPTIPTNSDYVDLTTAQTISGNKAFSSVLVIADNQGLATGTILSNKKILQRTTSGVITLGHTADELQLIGSTTNPKYTKDGTNFSDIALTSDIPSLTGYIQNTATGSASLTIGGVASTAVYATNVGYNSEATAAGQAFGHYAKASGAYSLALGQGATASGSYGIQIGKGTNSTANTLSVGFGSTGNYELLDGTTGLLPDARISSNIARTSDVPSIANLANTDLSNITSTAIETLLSTIYPVGAVYISTTATCPMASLMPNATWTKKAEDRVLQGSSSTHAEGTTIAAGLPNVYGNANFTVSNSAPQYAFRNEQSYGGVCNPDSNGWTMTIDASRSSSIYGNSTTVQAPAYVVSIWERTA